MQSSDPGHFFESDSIRASREYQRSRISYAKGSPFKLNSKILSLALHSSSIVAVGCSNSLAYIFDFSGRLEQRVTCRGHNGPVSSIALYKQAHQLMAITGSWDRSIIVFDGWNGAILNRVSGLFSDFVKSICIIPDEASMLIAAGDARGTFSMMNPIKNETFYSSKICSRSIESIKVLENKQVFVISSEGSLSGYHITSSQTLLKIDSLFSSPEDQHATSVYALECHLPDTIFTGSADGYIFGWDILSGERVWSSTHFKNWVVSLRAPLSRPDLLIAGLADGTILVFGDQILKSSISDGGHFDAVAALDSFIRDENEYLFSASLDGTIRTWLIPEKAFELKEIVIHCNSALFLEKDHEDLEALLNENDE